MTEKNLEYWSRMYQEQITHARHHETLRAQATNLIVVISGALLAFLSSQAATPGRQVILGAFLIVVNVYGLLMSLKHYERSQLHITVAREYRNFLSKNASAFGKTLNEIRELGRTEHKKNFRIVRNIRTYLLWSGLHLLLAVIGGLVAFSAR
jgi:hypothetical protein